jgi:hypothetical protein
MTPSSIPVPRWKPLQARVTSSPGARSAKLLDDVIGQFNVADNPRYRSEKGATWCNIFACDVMAAMGVVLPHWVTRNGQPVAFGPKGVPDDALETTANALAIWLDMHGVSWGWVRMSPVALQVHTNGGHPGVVVWNAGAGKHGHIAVARPGVWADGGPWTAQAGATCFAQGLASRGFGTHLKDVECWGAP